MVRGKKMKAVYLVLAALLLVGCSDTYRTNQANQHNQLFKAKQIIYIYSAESVRPKTIAQKQRT